VRGLTREEGIQLLDRAAEWACSRRTARDIIRFTRGALVFSAGYSKGATRKRGSARCGLCGGHRIVGNYYHDQYENGNRDVVAALRAEEAEPAARPHAGPPERLVEARNRHYAGLAPALRSHRAPGGMGASGGGDCAGFHRSSHRRPAARTRGSLEPGDRLPHPAGGGGPAVAEAERLQKICVEWIGGAPGTIIATASGRWRPRCNCSVTSSGNWTEVSASRRSGRASTSRSRSATVRLPQCLRTTWATPT